MSSKGWTESTFEVQTAKGGRWMIEMSSSKKSEAMKCVDLLMARGPSDGIRVTEQRGTAAKEKIIFEKKSEARDEQLKLDLIPDLDMCTVFADYYALPSRLTIGRLMRGYLDQQGLSALELLSSVGHLRALDRMDKYFPSAMQHISLLQSQKSDQTKTERLDKLYLVFKKVMSRARRAEEEYEKYASLLAEHGADRAISEIRAAHAKTASIVICGMLAAHIRGGSWAHKLGLLIDIAEQARAPGTVKIADEVIAEILSGVEVIDELFRGFSTSGDAWKVFVQLSSGRLSKPPKYMSPQIKRLNDLFIKYDLDATRSVLLGRISRGLGGTQKLTQNGRDADRNTFITLVRELAEPTGVCGGADMAEALVKRAKTLLGETGEDLPIETAVRQALYLMPSQASRLGLLLDLAASGLGQKHEALVRQQILHLLNELRSILDLFPADVQQEDHIGELDRLRHRLGRSTLPENFQSSITVSFDKLIKGEPEEPDQETTAKPKPKTKAKKLVKGETDEAFLEKGVILFKEEEPGDEAYLVIKGSVEVYRTHGGKKRQLAIVGAGEIIGEMSLVDNQPRMASARAVEDTVLVCISQENLQQRIAKLSKSDKVMHMLIKTLVRRLRGLARNTE